MVNIVIESISSSSTLDMMICGVDNDCCRYVCMFAITIGSDEEMFLVER